MPFSNSFFFLRRFFLVLSLILALLLVFTAGALTDEMATPEEEDQFAVAMNPERDYLIVVNDGHEYEFGGDYDRLLQPDIVYASDCDGFLTPIEKATNAAFSLLKQHLFTEGFTIELYSCFRTKDDQEWVYEHYNNLKDWSEANTVMRPGFSEHHTGLTLSFVVLWPSEEYPGTDVWTEETAEVQAKYPELRQIHEALADFGFIDRYPAGKEDITGVMPEPYEIRFVGSSKIAHEIMDNGLCLEEYLASR